MASEPGGFEPANLVSTRAPESGAPVGSPSGARQPRAARRVVDARLQGSLWDEPVRAPVTRVLQENVK